MKTLPLTQGLFAMVDDRDYEFLSSMNWCAWNGGRDDLFYAARRGKAGESSIVLMHDFLMGVKGVDHRDGNGLNNQRINLRKATALQNQGNARRRIDNTSGYKGVGRVGFKWRARISKHGKMVHLGLFDYPIQAARAYDSAAREYFGEFARTNLP